MSDVAKYRKAIVPKDNSDIEAVVEAVLKMPKGRRRLALRALRRNVCATCGDFVGDSHVAYEDTGMGYCDRCHAR